MATNRWWGIAKPVSQVVLIQVGGTVAAGQLYTVTINRKPVSYTATGTDTIASVATGLQAALTASGTPAEFQEVTWTTDGVSLITATAATPGVPFILTTSASGTGTLTSNTAVASSGPNHVDAAANWSLGAVPGPGDDVLIDGGPDLLYGFANLAPTAGSPIGLLLSLTYAAGPPAYNSLRVKASFTGSIGLPVWNTGNSGGFSTGTTGYYEYRARAFVVPTGCPVTVGEGDGSGPTRVNLSCGSVLSLVVLKTGTRRATGGITGGSAPVMNVSGCSSGTLSAAGGDIGLAADDDTLTTTLTTVSLSGSAAVAVGKGATVTTLNQDAGTVTALGAVGTLVIDGGTYVQAGGSLTTVTANGGTVDYRVGGTITTATFQGQGVTQNVPTLQCGNDPRGKTITNGSFIGGAVLADPYKTCAFSNPLTFDAASLAASNLGPRMTLTRT
ncbi:MAG: hypothetical protein JWO38_2347 [Gemmataceae bacterium]|nr:hypothetical protein [Gemmataceae bacterium]